MQHQPEQEIDYDDLLAEGLQDGATQGRAVAERVANLIATRYTTALIPDAQTIYSRAFLLNFIAAFGKEMRLRIAFYRDAAADAKRRNR